MEEQKTQKTKQFDELTKYERAMTTASIEQRLEAMTNEVQQMALALHLSISIDTTFHDWKSGPFTSGTLVLYNGVITRREMKAPGDFFGSIEEALAKKPEEKPEDKKDEND